MELKLLYIQVGKNRHYVTYAEGETDSHLTSDIKEAYVFKPEEIVELIVDQDMRGFSSRFTEIDASIDLDELINI